MTSLPAFILGALAVLGAPGPTNILLCASGTLVGLNRSLRLIVAAIAGYLLAVSALILAGNPLIAAFPLLGPALRIVLVLYLLLLAWRLWGSDPVDCTREMQIVTFGQVLLTTLLNPKGAIVAFLIFPPLGTVAAALPYAAIFVTSILLASSCWIAFGAMVGRIDSDRVGRTVPRIAAILLFLMATLTAGSAIAAFD